MREPATLSRRALAALPIVALAGTTRPTAVAASSIASSDDAALLDLGRQWQAAVAAVVAHDKAWSTDVSEAAYVAHEAVADGLFKAEQDLLLAIVATPARTVRGLAVKAEACAREFDAQGQGAEAVQAALDIAPDHETLVALSLMLDILKLARPA